MFEQAAEKLKFAAEAAPENPDVWYSWGTALLEWAQATYGRLPPVVEYREV